MGQLWYHGGDYPGSFDSAPTSMAVVADTVADCQGAENLLLAACLAAAARGDLSAFFDLGVAFSTGSHGACCDLVEAHKWFNLAAVAGHGEAQVCRAEIAEEMTAREIAEAQRRAREWLCATTRKAA